MKKILVIIIATFFVIEGLGIVTVSGQQMNLKGALPGQIPAKIGCLAYVSWWHDQYNSSQSDLSLDYVNQTHSNAISILATWYQTTYNSTSIFPNANATPDDSGVVHAIQKAHSLGLMVMLKPHIDPLDGQWRGVITFTNDTDWAAWFASYKIFINHYAHIAQANGVEIFCVGCELEKTVSRDAQWRDIIASVKANYTGPMTYAANHEAQMNVKFWDILDYVGIDAYYGLTSNNNPTQTSVDSAWSTWWNLIELWRSTTTPTKQIIFTEIGYRSMNGTNKNPADCTTNGTVNLVEQYRCYFAALKNVWNQTSFRGLFWWAWDTNPNQGGPMDNGYTPHQKPAEDLLKYWYGTYLVPELNGKIVLLPITVIALFLIVMIKKKPRKHNN